MFHIPVFVPDNYDSFIALIGLHAQVRCTGYSPDCGMLWHRAGGVRGLLLFSWKRSVNGGGGGGGGGGGVGGRYGGM